MASTTLIFVGALWLLCGIASGMIATHKGLSFIGFFFIGLLLGVIGLIIAAVVRGPASAPARAAHVPVAAAGWYPDPQNPAAMRYHDGYQWTQHAQAPAAPPSY